jgi:DNA-binding transcriptional LysR family regulator
MVGSTGIRRKASSLMRSIAIRDFSRRLSCFCNCSNTRAGLVRRMDLKQLGIFAAVAEHGGFTKAAIALDYSQSHVTTQVRKLEERLGVALFDRRGRGVRLTEAGRALLPYAHRLEALAAEAEAFVGENRSHGQLSIAASESLTIYRLPELLARLRAATPSLDIQVLAIDEAKIPRAAMDGDIDVAFVYATDPGERRVNEVLLDERSPVVVVSRALPLAGEGQLRASDLQRYAALVSLHPCPVRTSFERMAGRAGVSAPRVREFSSVEAIKRCAIHGLGYAVLPRITLERELNSGELVELHPPAALDKIATILVFAPNKARALNAFVAATRELYAAAS